jgi:predicted RNA polymerase sigma factor
MAPGFASTNWHALLKLYNYLLERKPIPIVRLNRSVILAMTDGVETAIDTILDIPDITELVNRHSTYAIVLGDLYGKAGNKAESRRLLQKAYDLTPSLAEKKLLQEKLAAIC